MKISLAGLAILALASTSASAHDFWLQPARWKPADEAGLEFTLEVGHGPDRQRSPIRASRILTLENVQPDGSIADLRPNLHLGEANGDLTAGGSLATIVLVTDVAAESHLDPVRFNAHLQSEGLTDAIAWREAHNQSSAEGSENYGRVAKALIRSASRTSVVQRPLGLELEIVPLRDVYAPAVTRLPVQVLFKRAPLKGATVKLYDLGNDGTPVATCTSDPDGRCTFDFARRGSWLVNVVWSTPNAAGSLTDFRTIFSSLSFGFDKEDAERDH